MLWKALLKGLCSRLKLRLVKSREWSCERVGVRVAWVQSAVPRADQVLPGKGETLEGVQALQALSVQCRRGEQQLT